jgi:hypothetical protein
MVIAVATDHFKERSKEQENERSNPVFCVFSQTVPKQSKWRGGQRNHNVVMVLYLKRRVGKNEKVLVDCVSISIGIGYPCYSSYGYQNLC